MQTQGADSVVVSSMLCQGCIRHSARQERVEHQIGRPQIPLLILLPLPRNSSSLIDVQRLPIKCYRRHLCVCVWAAKNVDTTAWQCKFKTCFLSEKRLLRKKKMLIQYWIAMHYHTCNLKHLRGKYIIYEEYGDGKIVSLLKLAQNNNSGTTFFAFQCCSLSFQPFWIIFLRFTHTSLLYYFCSQSFRDNS